MIKTIAELIEERRNRELAYIEGCILRCGGDGLYCPDGCEEACGCHFDDFIPCGEALEDLECVPAKRGEDGAMYPIEEPTDV